MVGIAEIHFVETILSGVSDGVIMTDSRGIMVHFNVAAQELLETPAEKVIGKPLVWLSEAYRGVSTYREKLQKYVENPGVVPPGKFCEEKLYLINKTVYTRISSVYEQGRFTGLLLIFRDDSFSIANISHELRTPLTPIKGFTDLLLMQALGEINDKQKTILTHIKNSANRLSYLIEDVLYVSAIDSGRDPLKMEIVDVQKVVETAVQHLQERVQQQGPNLNVAFDVHPETPLIEADLKKVTRIITNVIENAFNYTRQDGKITIRIQPRSGYEHILVSIEDTGVGIPKEFHQRVWNRFARHHVTMENNTGSISIGLGLSIAKDLVEMHEGEIWFESEEGVGTIFYISLPIRQPAYRTAR